MTATRALLILIVAASMICSSHAVICATNCTCAQKQEGVKVNCSNLHSFPKFTEITTNITVIDLKGNHLSGVTADDLAELPNLQLLFLDANDIKTINNDTFSRNNELKEVVLNNNNLEYVEPGVFFNLESLISIRLKKNRISHLRSFTFYNLSMLNLIDMSDNGLKTIDSKAFYGLEKLTHLFLSENLLTSVPSETFKLIPTVEYLYLDSNKITELMNEPFSMLKNLSRLHMSHNNFSYIGDLVFQNIPIQYLVMINCGLDEVPAAVDSLYEITDLDLSLNNFTVIPSAIFFNLVKLVFLRISYLKELKEVHTDAFVGLDNLVSVHMGNCPNLKELPDKAFWKSHRLWGLDLQGNGLRSIPENLAQWDKLKFVDVTNNDLQCDCKAEWIKKRLQRNGSWSAQVQNSMYHLNCTDKFGLEKIRNFDFKSLHCNQLTTSKPVKRVLTGLVAAVIAVTLVLVICVACGFRKKIINKYRQFKYSRHKDEAPYTIAKYSDLDARETRMAPNHVDVFRDEKDDEELI